MAKKEFEYEYDPIKEQVGGKEAEKVQWSTKALNAAVEGIKKGLPLKANPFIGKNTKLLKPDLVYKRTAEEIEDYIRCMKDPVYFASKCYLMQPTGLEACVLRDYQIDYLRHLQQHRFSIFLSCRQSGKSTTTAIYCLWVILFNTDKNGLILSKSGPAGADLLSKIKDMYLYLPYHLKIGTMKWNQSEISFDNNSKIATEAFGPTAGLGKTINFLILDEFAWCPPNDVELFYNNIIPTVTTISNSNVCIMSTQNGFNLFYRLYMGALKKENAYAPFKVDWWQVPQYNDKLKVWEKRTEKWHDYMRGVLGSEEAFQYQYGTSFSASDYCLVSRECLSRIHENQIKFCNRDELSVSLQYKENLYWNPNFDLNTLKTGWFVILCDLAEGGGGDYTIFNILQVIDKDKFVQVGYWRSNKVDLKLAALDFWLLTGQLFNNDRCIFSIEWNTYGALFYAYLLNLNEYDLMPEYSWRFNTCQELDVTQIANYKKGDDDIPGKLSKNRKMIPGLRLTASIKASSCTLLKMLIESADVDILDLETISELENFEDKTGSGSYKASIGHDDLIMTFVQIPMLKQTPRYKDYMEEFISGSVSAQAGIDYYNPYENSIFQPIGGTLPTFMQEYLNPYQESIKQNTNNINVETQSYDLLI